MTQMTNLAVAADYADAMLVARRAKNWLFLLLLLLLLLQIGIFAAARFVPNVHLSATVQNATGSTATTQVSLVTHSAASDPSSQQRLSAFVQYLVGLSGFLGVVSVVVLAVVLLLIVGIMLVGRLVGVTHVTSAFVWCVVLAVLLVPWQSVLNSDVRSVRLKQSFRGHNSGDVISVDGAAASALVEAGAAEQGADVPAPATTDVRVPGVLYTWPELSRDYDFSNNAGLTTVLKWARFVGFPVIAIVLLLLVQGRSSRGLRFALGEAEMQVNVNTVNPIP